MRLSFRRALALGLAGVLVLSACGSDDDEPEAGGTDETDEESGGSDDGGDAAAILGEENPATGEPVKVGVITDGRTPSIDNSIHTRAARATIEYVNQHLGGIGGRPIEPVVCESQGDPGKATECANEMIQEQVALVVMPESQQALAVHTVTKANKMPLFVYGVGDAAILLDNEASFALADPTAGLADLPIDIAKAEGVDKVSAVVIDVPAATGFYKAIGAKTFSDAGVELELITVPPGQADMTPQMTQVANGGPTHVHIIGNDAFCIAAMNGLASAGYEGTISVLFSCASENVAKAVDMEGVHLGVNTALGDPEEPGIQLLGAVMEEFGNDVDDPKAVSTTFITVMAMRLGLEGITGDLTPENVVTTIKAMESTPIPGGKGLEFRCNGKAKPLTPAVCTRGALRVQLDADGEPVLPYKAVGASSIED